MSHPFQEYRGHVLEASSVGVDIWCLGELMYAKAPLGQAHLMVDRWIDKGTPFGSDDLG